MTQWASDMHARIAAAIKRARGKRSAQWLADRTVELGYPITRAQIANYESGRKKNLDLAELMVLAEALNTAPVALVYPSPLVDEVEVLPDVECSRYEAAQWFSGLEYRLIEQADTGADKVRASAKAFHENVLELTLFREQMALVVQRGQILKEIEGLGEVGTAAVLKVMEQLDSQLERIQQELRDYYAEKFGENA